MPAAAIMARLIFRGDSEFIGSKRRANIFLGVRSHKAIPLANHSFQIPRFVGIVPSTRRTLRMAVLIPPSTSTKRLCPTAPRRSPRA